MAPLKRPRLLGDAVPITGHKNCPSIPLHVQARFGRLVLVKNGSQECVANLDDLDPMPLLMNHTEKNIEAMLRFVLQTKEPFGECFGTVLVEALLLDWLDEILNPREELKKAVDMMIDCLRKTNCPMDAVFLLVIGSMPFLKHEETGATTVELRHVDATDIERMAAILALQPLLRKTERVML